jgi:type II secretory pathway component PulC
MRWSTLAALAVVVSLGGCQAIKEQLGLESETSEAKSEEPDEAEADDEAAAEAEGEDDGKGKRRKKRKRRKPKAPEPPPPPETELYAALGHAVVADETKPNTFRIDPFVLTLVADTLGRGEEAVPFTRVTPKERKAGAPVSFRVGELPTPSLWRTLGLRPDDLVLSVEDLQPPGPRNLAKLRERIQREGTLTVKVQRDGVERELKYTIAPGLAWTRYLETEGGRTFAPPPDPKPPRGGNSPGSGSGSSASKGSSGKSSSKPAAVPVTCSGSTCRVPKWYFDSLVGSSSKAKQQMRGKSIGSGFKVSFVGPASRKAGFSVGDVITKINGRRTNNQLQMLGLYGSLKSTKKFRVEFTRGISKRSKTILVEG